MQLESFTLLVSIDCIACRTSIPVNGVVPAVRCYHCGTESALDTELWTSTFVPEAWAEALDFAPGEARTLTKLGHPEIRVAYGRRVPRCQTCKGPDLDPAVLATLVPHGQCFCPGCGTTIRVRPADALCTELNPRARFVVGETAHDAAARAAEAKTTPILFACMGCGGGLTVDGSQRQVGCTYCGASNYLPDGLWQKLRPVPTPEVFFLICEYDEAARIEARWIDDDARREDAARPDLPPALYQRLASDDDSDVRAAVAGNPAVPPQLLDVLAGDDAYRVRAAVAGNPATDPATLHRLVADRDSDVLAALSGNPRLPVAALEALARSETSRKREAAAKHPAVPLELLHRLARDAHRDVREAARERLAELRAQGVDVNQGRGLLGRLFG